jgi:isocitrate dehydrogenase
LGRPNTFLARCAEKRGHDAQLIKKVEKYLPTHDTSGLDISIMPPVEACQASCDNARSV